MQIIRRTADGALDEAVVSLCEVPIERMSESDFWNGLSRERGAAGQTLHAALLSS